jgi:PAS domain S-box-containing protein
VGIDILGARAGIVVLVNPEEDHLEVVHLAGHSDENMKGWHRFPLSARVPLSDAVRDNAVVIVKGRSDWESEYPHLVASIPGGIFLASVSLPLATGGRPFGALHFSFPTERTFSDADLNFLEELSQLCALALDRALVNELAQRESAEKDIALQAISGAHLRTEAVLESIAEMFYAVDCDFRFTYVNGHTEKVWGMDRADLLGQIVWDVFPGAVGSESYRAMLEVMQDRRPIRLESISPARHRWTEYGFYPSDDGGLSVYFRDIHDRKAAEALLARSKEDLQFATSAAGLGTFYCDFPLDKIVWNDICKEHFFLPPDADIDFDLFYSLLHPEDVETTRQAINRAMVEHVEYNVEYRTCGQGGQIRWVNAVGRFFYDSEGRPTRFDGITIDISDRKRAEQEQIARAQREALINRINAALRSLSDPTEIQSTAVELLGVALGADRCYFALYDLSRPIVTVAAEFHRADLPPMRGVHTFQNTREMFAELYRSSSTSIINDTETASITAQTRANMESLRLRARVSVAVAEGNDQKATLTAAMSESARDWSSDEVALVEIVATNMRTAVEMARVQQREHRIAIELQNALQPAVQNRVPNLRVATLMRPALDEAAVGGDFFDVFPLDKTLYAMVVGDVSGKGLAAATQHATVRNMLRGFLYQYGDPAEAVSVLNKVITDHNLVTGFVTALVCTFDTSTGTITYAPCGHEPAMICRAATNDIEVLSTYGPPIGVVKDFQYEEYRTHISGCDTLLLYTDGITEAGQNRRQLLGVEGLIELFSQLPQDLPVDDLAERIVEQVNSFAGGFRDDVCLLVARLE